MVVKHIKKIRNPHARRAIYGLLGLKLLFLKLVFLKTLIFNIASLKLLAIESVFLMSLFSFVPHVTFAQTPPAPIDYSISNSTYPVMTADGEMVVFMYYFQNESDPHIPGSDVVISANIPVGMTYHSHEGPVPSSITDTQITWNIPDNNNRFGMILLRLMVQPTASGPLTNTVTINHANPDPIQSNNSATATVIANTSGPSLSNVDLAISKTVNRTTAAFMDDIIFTINYINNGTQTAQGVKVYEVLPPELYIISTSREPDNINNNLYTFDIGTLAPGEGGTITLRTSILPIVPNNHTIINYAVISSQMVESDISNNSTEVSILVSDPEPSLFVDIHAPKQTICVDETLRFTVNLGNQGISAAYNVSIRHQKPDTLAFLTSNRTFSSPQLGQFIWDYNTTFFPGSEGSFTFDLLGIAPGVDQAIPVTIYENNIPLASSTFYVTIVPESVCNQITEPDPIPGCTNPLANNYNTNATINDGSCIYTNPNPEEESTQTIPGCTNPTAINYNASATINNGSCIFDDPNNPVPGCTNPSANNYNADATVNDGSCQYTTVDTGVQEDLGTTDEEESLPEFAILPRNIPEKEINIKSETRIPAQPSQTNFFTTQPAPRRTTASQSANELRQVVAQVAEATQDEQPSGPVEIPTECEATMIDIYNYAKDADLVTDKDIPNLCSPFDRAKLAELMVNYALKLALVEPNLRRRCTFDDVDGYSNEQRFYMALACDFGFLGVSDEGVVNTSFRPGDTVTRGELAVTMARFLFGDTLKPAPEGIAWYQPAMMALNQAFVMRSIDNPHEEMLLGHALAMMRRIDLADLLQNTKYVRRRQ